ncbi:uncharacterized protein LOC110643234 isoform X4 [Hevea brasiliensis]|uniref:uncharacterized protein LOC110643234 isoform X4 n=1 Tax=Hevea brasiliensis TaxID=3981 RepID=UPI0025E6DFED|nr:uncharacterized protein LOC110643234 isoform X4 [Hevea brasiliensis]
MALDPILAIVPMIVKYTFVPVKRHLSYAFNCGSKVEKLKNQVENLKNKRDGLKPHVDEATRRGDEIYANVQDWLTSVDEAIGEADDLVDEEQARESCFLGLIPNLKKRYKLSKKVEKKAQTVAELREKCKFDLDRIACRPPLWQIVPPSVYNNEELHSRISILEKVMNALRDPAFNMIGVYGLGGVGKTTLAKEVRRKAIEDKLFDVVLMGTVSETPELRKIQGTFADMLGLELKEETEEGRACRLRQRLLQEKKILVILDDIWEQLEPEKLGIPFGNDHKGCKIFLTSRREDILSRDMGTQESFELRVLSEAEAWSLFVTVVGDVTNQDLRSIATEVAKKCAGLPVLIVTVAGALKNRDLNEWNVALEELSKVDNEGIQSKVYATLKLSYNHLASEELKSFFLLCAQIAQSDIQIGDLLLYSMGLDLLRSKDTVEYARNRVYKLVRDLKASCLLLDGDRNGSLKMHDVVRDTALDIASKSQHPFTFRDVVETKEWPNRDFRSCSRIALPSCEIHELPERLECPKLELLVLGRGSIHSKGPDLNISDIFFEGITKLKVLHFTGMFLRSLPPSLGYLINLLTLCLDECVLRDASVIGELKRLEVLSFRRSMIEELPREIAHLTRLKLLDLSDCDKLKVIPANVISRLSLLEELYMLKSFGQWELQGLNSSNNASLAELKNLSRLTTLEIDVPDVKMLPKDLFSNKLERYDIVIGKKRYWYDEYLSSRRRRIRLNTDIHLDHGVDLLLKKAEVLYLDNVKGIKSILYDMDREGFQRLKHLDIDNSDDIQYVINSTVQVPSLNVFPILESLSLNNLVSLEKICYGRLTTGPFAKLRKLEVRGCNGLKDLFSFSMVRNLSQLQEMTVSDCQNMEEIVIDQSGVGEDNIEVAEFSQLRSLTLEALPALKSFCLKVKESTSDDGGSNEIVLEDDVHNPRPLFEKMVSFPNLEELSVESIGCQDLKYLFTTSFVKSLLRLKTLWIKDCGFMERIVLTEEFAEEERLDKIIFSDLENLTIWDLPNLTSFCDGHLIEFCSLTNLRIRNCPVFKTFVSNLLSGSLFDEKVAFSSLEHLSISSMSNLERIWHNQLAGGSFCMLKSMTVGDCKNLHTLFPSNDLRRFQKLEQLNLTNCDSLEEIYQLPEFNAEEESFAIDLNLRSMEISDLKNLKNLFPASVAQNLLLLEKLSVYSCGVEAIVAKAEGAKAAPSFVFPKLLSLKLSNLEDIRRFYPGIHSLEFPRLKDLKVHDCGNGMEFCSDLFGLQGQHGEEQHHITIQQPLHLEKKVFPNLEELSSDGQMIEMILQCQLPKGFLFKVKSVELSFIRGKSYVALFGFLQRLPNLETVSVKDSLLQGFVLQCEDNDGAMLPRIRNLKLWRLDHIKHIWKPHPQMDLVLQNLQTMNVFYCFDLISLAPSSSSFQNLTTLKVQSCKVLKHLVTPSAAKSMVQLVTMEIRACEMLTEIVVDEQNGTPEEIEFGKLKTLRLIDLESLTSFCFGGFTFKFPCLEVVTVERCPNMRTFSAGVLSTPKLQCVQLREIHFQKWLWEGDLNTTIRQLYTEMDGFNGIKKFILSKFPHIKEKWHTQLPLKLLDGLSELVVDNCEYFSKALSSNQLQFLNRLEVLIVEKCSSLEEIFDLEGMNAVEGHDELVLWLQELHLIDLPKLRRLWNKDPRGILDFKNLRLLKVHNCSSLGNIFTLPMALELVKLECIEIKRCSSLEEIINKEGEEEGARDKTIFPSLHSIILEYLPSLVSFYSRSDVLNCPSLEKIEIIDCPKMETFSIKNSSGVIVEGSKEPCKRCFDAPTVPIFSGKDDEEN